MIEKICEYAKGKLTYVFILDVLKNYTTYNRYFKLIEKVSEEKKYEKKKAIKELMRYVEKHPHHLESKAEIILDHFLEKVYVLLK